MRRTGPGQKKKVESKKESKTVEDDEASEEEEEERDDDGNEGWADAMAKVLAQGRNTEKTVSVLSKAKKDNTKKVTGEDGEKVLEPLAVRKARKKELDSIGRSMPNPLNRNIERTFARIATRGVVQLFNAVRDQQKEVKTQLKEAGGSFRKRENVLKNINKDNFINILSGKSMEKVEKEEEEPEEKRSRIEEETEEEKKNDNKQSSWNILRDDFMLGAKMKDWDKESDGE